VQETRLYDPDRGETRSMRSKEDAHDYRYFPDPDLPPLVIGEEWIARVQSELPELPEAMQRRFEAQYALPAYDAAALTGSRALAAYFETAVAALAGADAGAAKLVANWVQGELTAALNKAGIDISHSPVPPARLAALLARIRDNTISGKIAKDVFDAMWAGEGEPEAIIAAKGLTQVSDETAIAQLVDGVLAANPAIVAEFHAGKEKAFNSLVGKTMAASRGKANPAQVNSVLRKKLGA
jgi:aspartyl-tRNA(Asn)/glutamyl-tRNA(Gln) amidotransferase subunit B